MKINEIIGKDKIFEPPFTPDCAESPYIVDANRKIVITIDYTSLENLDYKKRMKIRAELARHICDLLNREHGGSKK